MGYNNFQANLIDDLDCYIKKTNQAGRLFKHWDGMTYGPSGFPSESSTEDIDVVGPFTKYCMRLVDRDQLHSLYNNVINAVLAQATCGGTIQIKCSANSAGQGCASYSEGPFRCIDAFTGGYYNEYSYIYDGGSVESSVDFESSCPAAYQIRARCIYYPICLDDGAEYFYQICDMAQLYQGPYRAEDCVNIFSLNTYVQSGKNGNFTLESSTPLNSLNFSASSLGLLVAGSNFIGIPVNVKPYPEGPPNRYSFLQSSLGGVLAYVYKEPCGGDGAGSYEEIPGDKSWYAVGVFANDQSSEHHADQCGSIVYAGTHVDNFITNAGSDEGYAAAGAQGSGTSSNVFILTYIPSIPRLGFNVAQVGTDPETAEFWWDPGIIVNASLIAYAAAQGSGSTVGQDEGDKSDPRCPNYLFQCNGPSDSCNSFVNFDFLASTLGGLPKPNWMDSINILYYFEDQIIQGYRACQMHTPTGAPTGRFYADSYGGNTPAYSHASLEWDVTGMHNFTVKVNTQSLRDL